MTNDPMDHTHEGTRSWWNGTVKTLCGLTLPPTTRWVFFGPSCPACKAAIKARKRR